MSGQPWRINPVLPVTKSLGAVAVVVLVFAFGRQDPIQWGMAAGAATGLGIWAARDLLAPVRLAADAAGLTVVAGYLQRRRLSWTDVVAMSVDRRQRLGLATAMLEIDTDDALYLFSMHDLGADPEDVLAALRQLGSQDSDAAAA